MNRLLTLVLRHWKPLVGWNLLLVLVAGLALAKSKPVWTATSSLILSANTGNLSANLGKLGEVSDGEAFFSQQVNPLKVLSSIILSDDTLEKVLAIDPEREKFKSLAQYKTIFKVTPEETTTIVALSITGSKPEIAQTRGDALVRIMQARMNSLRQDDAAQRSGFMQKELDQAKKNLNTAQVELSQFKQSSGLVSSDEQTKQLVSTISSLTATQADALAKARATQAQVKMLSSRLGMSPNQAIQSLRLNERQDYQLARKKFAEIEISLSQAQSFYQPGAAEILYLQAEREKLAQQIKRYIQAASATSPGVNLLSGEKLSELMQQLILTESQGNAAQQQANQLQTKVTQLSQNLQALPVAQSRLLELQRQYDITEGVYNGLVAKVQETRVNSFSNYPSVQVLDQPKVDPTPGGSKKIPILMGTTLAALFGSIALMLWLESRNPLLSPADLKASSIPVIGNLPLIKLVHGVMSPDFANTVEWQRLASSVSLLPLISRRLLITSAAAAEGKTTVTLGLAMALTTLGFKVLVVEGDFHKRALSQRLGWSLPPTTRLPVPIASGIDLLSLPIEARQVMEFVARGQFEAIIVQAQAEGNYDYVLIDSAPVCMTGESALMATVAQQVLWVVRPGLSERFLVRKAIAQVSRHPVQWTGMVMNGTEPTLEQMALPYAATAPAAIEP